jgi:hypothetical protein
METKITCPHCTRPFDIGEVLANKLRAYYQEEFEKSNGTLTAVQKTISSLFGSIKGIAGKDLDATDIFELPMLSVDKID